METLKDIKFQEDNKKFAFLKKNAKYFIAAVIFIVMVIVAAFFLKKDEITSGIQYSADGVEMFEVDAYPAVMSLIEQYYACYAAGDFATLQTLAAPFSEHELAYCSSMVIEFVIPPVQNASQIVSMRFLISPVIIVRICIVLDYLTNVRNYQDTDKDRFTTFQNNILTVK